jgi:hypothetical protein
VIWKEVRVHLRILEKGSDYQCGIVFARLPYATDLEDPK